MFRKLILAAALAAVVLTGLTLTPATADASPPALLPHHRFEVLAERGSASLQSHGTYRLHAEAELVAIRLRHQGFRVEIRQF